MTILRRGRLGPQPSDVAEYTSSIESDVHIVEPVIKINEAHVVMLAEEGIINPKEGSLILKALAKLDPKMKLDPQLEDVHMNIEAKVIEELGEAVGGKLHTGKSRNDQVSAAIRVALRSYTIEIITALTRLQRVILARAQKYLTTIMPGYTHLQHAQPVTLAHHLLAYYDAFERDILRLMDAYCDMNISPMGAVALATTSFKINRKRVADLLGFQGLMEHSMDAVSARDFAVKTLSDLALTMNDLSRMAEELILWSTIEFNIVEIPDEFSSTSSIMPQKKNPVVLELMRAKAKRVQGDLFTALNMTRGLPLSYNIDLQEVTPHIWNSCQITLSSIKIMTALLSKVKFKTDRMLELVINDFSTATDLADILVRELNIPFRIAHQIVGRLVRRLIAEGKALEHLTPEMLVKIVNETIGKKVSISQKILAAITDPLKSVSARNVIGGPAPAEVSRMVKKRAAQTLRDDKWCKEKKIAIRNADQKLAEAIQEVYREAGKI